MRKFIRPIVQTDAARPANALPLAGGRLWFDHVEILHRTAPPIVLSVDDLDAADRNRLSAPRPPVCGIDMQRTSIMGILNVTPDSFSDGGLRFAKADAVEAAREMAANGADMVDIGGESTRPGASYIDPNEEIRRVVPVIEALRRITQVPVSIDTRKAAVARAAITAGASLFNDVTALTFDPASLATAAELAVPACIMHSAGDPETMQDDPLYENVLLDVYEYLEERITACEAAGIARKHIMVDPGIGFGKTQAHNLALLRGIALFHGLGCPILLGVSRKKFIGTIGGAAQPALRAPGSIAVALDALNQGVQMLRVHDIVETKQAVALWQALHPEN